MTVKQTAVCDMLVPPPSLPSLTGGPLAKKAAAAAGSPPPAKACGDIATLHCVFCNQDFCDEHRAEHPETEIFVASALGVPLRDEPATSDDCAAGVCHACSDKLLRNLSTGPTVLHALEEFRASMRTIESTIITVGRQLLAQGALKE